MNGSINILLSLTLLEYPAHRSKYISSDTSHAPKAFPPKHAALQGLEKAASSSGRSSPGPEAAAEHVPQRFNTLAGGALNGLNVGAGPNAGQGSTVLLNRHPSAAKDPKARAKSREYLKQCLQEISYLTSTNTLNPLPERPAPGSVLPQNPPRPRKAMSDNVPSTFPGSSEPQGSMNASSPAAATAKRQRSLEKVGAGGNPGSNLASKPNARGLQLLDEPLLEREEEGAGGDASRAASDDDGGPRLPVEGLALDTEPAVEGYRDRSNDSDSGSLESISDTSSGLAERSSASSADEPAEDFGEEPQNHEEHLTAVYRPSGSDSDEWSKLRDAGRAGQTAERLGTGKGGLLDEQAQLQATSDRVQELMRQGPSQTEEDDLASLSLSSPRTDGDMKRVAAETAADSQMWKPKRVLRGHLDAVRAVAFDTDNLCLYSASDDNTIKFWKVDDAFSKTGKPPQGPQESDPIVTLRGHSAAVTCLALSSSKRLLYSGSVDASIVVWRLLDNKRLEPYPPYDKSMELSKLVGHSQAIWDLCILPTKNDEEGLLASVSADGSVKIWSMQEPEAGGRLLLTFDYFGTEPSAEKAEEKESTLAEHDGKLPVPTSITACLNDLRRCAVSFSNSTVKMFDVQTGHEVLHIAADQHYDGTEASQINKIVSHPTLPVLITGHENNHIKFFDANTGACTLSMVGHLDSVTTLDIDPSGLTLVSGGHDCSVRFWDIVSSSADERAATAHGDSKKQSGVSIAGNGVDLPALAGPAVCVQEITAHRKKGGEGVLYVRYHPSAPWFCSTGADGVVRLYG